MAPQHRGGDLGDEHAEMVRSEEEMDVGVRRGEAGRVRAVKRVGHEHVSEVVEAGREEVEIDRVPGDEGDSGEVVTLADGSVSIPVFEERLVVEKRRVVKERVIVRKQTVVEDQLVEADLAKERIELTADPEVAGRVHDDRDAGNGGRS